MKKYLQFYPNKEQSEFIKESINQSLKTIVTHLQNGNVFREVTHIIRNESLFSGYIMADFVINMPGNMKEEDLRTRILYTEIYHRPLILVNEREDFDFIIQIDNEDIMDIKKHI